MLVPDGPPFDLQHHDLQRLGLLVLAEMAVYDVAKEVIMQDARLPRRASEEGAAHLFPFPFLFLFEAARSGMTE